MFHLDSRQKKAGVGDTDKFGWTAPTICQSSSNLKLGYDLGANLQQSFGVFAAALDLCTQTQPTLNDKAGIEQ